MIMIACAFGAMLAIPVQGDAVVDTGVQVDDTQVLQSPRALEHHGVPGEQFEILDGDRAASRLVQAASGGAN